MRVLCAILLFFSTGLLAQEAPEFQKIAAWIPPKPVTMQSQKGHVVLVDFWDYSCINRTLPHIKAWHEKYIG